MSWTPPPPPDGCETTEQHERAATELANKLEAQIDGLLGDGEVAPMVVSRAKELALAVVRLRKLASELALAREQTEHANWTLAEYKRMHGLGTAERPRLRRKGVTQ